MAEAVNPTRVEIKALMTDFEFDLGGRFKAFAVENDLLHTLVARRVVHQAAEELVNHSTLQFMGVAGIDRKTKRFDPTSGEISAALPVVEPVLLLSNLNRARGMVGKLGRIIIIHAEKPEGNPLARPDGFCRDP